MIIDNSDSAFQNFITSGLFKPSYFDKMLIAFSML